MNSIGFDLMPALQSAQGSGDYVGHARRRVQECRRLEGCNYTIAGVAVCLRFANQMLRDEISPAFEHLRAEHSPEPTLSILVDDTAADCLFKRLAGNGSGKTDLWVIEAPDSTVIVQQMGRAVSVLDKTNGTVYWSVPSARRITYLERAAPLRPILSLWMGMHGRYLFHGAAVGEKDVGVLIIGPSGSGKSTTALACLDAGMAYAGDDQCLLSVDDVPYAHSMYGVGKLTVADRGRFVGLTPASDLESRSDSDKVVYFLNRLHATMVCSGFPLRAILLARITGLPETRICRTNSAQGLLALAPSGALHFPATRSGALRCFNSAVRTLPVYNLELGSNVLEIPSKIRGLLRQL